MQGLTEWVKNITYYLIFMAVAVNLLPNKKYEKYFRLFSGMVLILLVLKPFTGGLRLDDKLAYAFESISFQNEAANLKTQLSQMERKRLKSMIAQYEETVENDLKTMVKSSGFVCEKANAVIDGNEADGSFGRVTKISLLLSKEEAGEGNGGKRGRELGQGETVAVMPVKPVPPVAPIEVKAEGEDKKKAVGGSEEMRQKDYSALAGLRRRISEYYNLEGENIEIRMENG